MPQKTMPIAARPARFPSQRNYSPSMAGDIDGRVRQYAASSPRARPSTRFMRDRRVRVVAGMPVLTAELRRIRRRSGQGSRHPQVEHLPVGRSAGQIDP